MIEKIKREIPVFEFEKFHGEKNLVHFVTSRSGGFSSGDYESLNLSYNVGDLPGNVAANRKKLANILSLKDGAVHFPDQGHTSYVREVTNTTTPDDLKKTDALITNTKNVCISVLTADCAPILLYDPIERVAGVVHAGWKGTVGRIAARTVEAMISLYRIKPKNLLACIGPSISQNNYEVGEEVVKQFEFWFADTPAIFMKNQSTSKIHIDLWKANRQLLLRYGVPENNIEVCGICTYDNPELFFSARRDGFQSGRFTTGIMLT